MLGIMTRTKSPIRRKACSIIHKVNMTSVALESFITDLPSPASEYQSGNQVLIWLEVKAKINRFEQALSQPVSLSAYSHTPSPLVFTTLGR